MNGLPRVLVIDDECGGRSEATRLHRTALCMNFGLRDATGDDDFVGNASDPVAEVVFHSGQIRRAGNVENDLLGTLDAIRRGWRASPRWAMILLDLHFKTGRVVADGQPEGREGDRDPQRYFGLDVLEALAIDPELRDIPVIVLSSMDREAVERRLSRLNAGEFVAKTEGRNDIDRERMQYLLHYFGLLPDDEPRITGRAPIVGESVSLLKALRQARRRARRSPDDLNDNVLILGETGTGKELLAAYMQEWLWRWTDTPREPPLATVNGGTQSSAGDANLFLSEVFGHEKGAFTGATERRVGAAERARNGILLIDEFGKIRPDAMSLLLRLLDTSAREMQRLGASDAAHRVNLFVLLATNETALASGKGYHGEVLARIKATWDPIVLPALRDRREDIPQLVDHFLRRYEGAVRQSFRIASGGAPGERRAQVRQVEPEALAILQAYDWPTNIRELAGVVERAVRNRPAMGWLTVADLPTELLGSGASAATDHKVTVSLGTPASSSAGLDGLVEQLRGFEPEPDRPVTWAGKLPMLRAAYTDLAERLFKAALLHTRRPAPEDPGEGHWNVTAATKMLLGDGRLDTTQCYDEIKRLFKYARPSDPAVAEVFEYAKEQRSTKKQA